MTLTATYNPIQYTVTFDGNGADNLTAMDGDTMQMQYDQAQAIPRNKFTKQYYTFVGWSTKKDEEIVYYDGASINNLVNTNGTEVKLYAVWKQDTVDILVNDGVNSQYTITVGQGDVHPDSVTVPRTGYTLYRCFFCRRYQMRLSKPTGNTSNTVCKMVYQRIYHSVL